MEIIIKYKNRKMYRGSGYISLIDIVRIIEKDISFKIVDKESGEDITHSVVFNAFSRYFDKALSLKKLKALIKKGNLNKIAPRSYEPETSIKLENLPLPIGRSNKNLGSIEIIDQP